MTKVPDRARSDSAPLVQVLRCVLGLLLGLATMAIHFRVIPRNLDDRIFYSLELALNAVFVFLVLAAVPYLCRNPGSNFRPEVSEEKRKRRKNDLNVIRKKQK